MLHLIIFSSELQIIHFLETAFILFILGVLGIILNNRNIITVLMSIELMLISINFNFIIISSFHDDIIGQIFSLFILTVAAAESAIGLAILIVFYRLQGTISIHKTHLIKG